MKPLHAPLPLARRLGRVLGPVVQVAVLAMLHPGQDLALRGTIALPLVGDHHPWNVLTALEERAEALLGGLFVAPPLAQDIEDIAIVIDGPPEIVALRVDRDEHLIQMPCVAWAGTPATELIGILLPAFTAPLSDGFVRHDDPTNA